MLELIELKKILYRKYAYIDIQGGIIIYTKGVERDMLIKKINTDKRFQNLKCYKDKRIFSLEVIEIKYNT